MVEGKDKMNFWENMIIDVLEILVLEFEITRNLIYFNKTFV